MMMEAGQRAPSQFNFLLPMALNIDTPIHPKRVSMLTHQYQHPHPVVTRLASTALYPSAYLTPPLP